MKISFQKHKSLKMLLSTVLVMTMASNNLVIQALQTHEYLTGGFPGVNGIYYTYSSGTSSTYYDDIKYAAHSWSKASSHVNLVLNTGVSSQGIPIAQIIVSVMQYTSEDPDQLGLMIPYKSFTPNSASQSYYNYEIEDCTDTWVKAFCYVYRHKDFLNTKKDYTIRRNVIRKTITHELGHALSLKHPDPASVDAVMNEGWNQYYFVRKHDKNNLIAKWGA